MKLTARAERTVGVAFCTTSWLLGACEKPAGPEATTGRAPVVAHAPSAAPTVPVGASAARPLTSAERDPCAFRATCGGVAGSGEGITFAASYCQGDSCRSARSPEECNSRDVVTDCERIASGTDGRPDCLWDDAAATHGIGCRPNK